jgi:DNA sulfur modification protein DndB
MSTQRDAVLAPYNRLKGLDTAISGKDHEGELIEGLQPDHSLANDDLSVILVPYEPAKRSRKIFNKVNKYAKQTSKGDNIVTSEDDAFAIIARWLMGSDGRTQVIKQELVNWKSNTLTDTQTMFTTISVLYESAKKLLDAHDVNPQFRPTPQKLEELYEEASGFWATLLKDFKIYKQAVEGPKENLPKVRKQNLALKPVAQLAIVEAYTIASGHGMSLSEFLRGLNKIPWDIGSDLWLNILTLPGPKVLAGKTAVLLGARLVAHLAGTKFSKEEHDQLLDDFRRAHGDDRKQLPKPVV